MVISIDAKKKKAFDKIQHTFMIKTNYKEKEYSSV